MNDAKKTNKRKLLIRYLILAACILVIAAVTVITVFAANNWFRADVSIDDNQGGELENPPDEPVIVVTTFAMPLSEVNVTKTYTFDVNETLSGIWEYHKGIDLTAEVGTPVSCCLDGTVASVEKGHQLFGTTVTVVHDNGIKTVYRFIDVKDGLKEGDKVKRGEVIGTIAQPDGREAEQGAHLHFEVYENGIMADPEDYLETSAK